MSYNKTVIDFNFERHEDLSTLKSEIHLGIAVSVNYIFVAVFLGCTSTGRVGLCFLWFCVQELPKAQLAVILVLKRLRRRGIGLKSHPTDWEKPGIEPATPGLQDIGLSPTPRRLLVSVNYYFSGMSTENEVNNCII